MNLYEHFVAFEAPFSEGAVYSARQNIGTENVEKATLYITALGVFSVDIDGEKVGDEILAPGYTYYPRDLHYREYDITKMVKENSVMRVYLGQGWYCGRFTFENKTQIYGQTPAVSWEVNIKTKDGEVLYFSDGDNVMPVSSPYEYAGLYDGEIYHADEIGGTAAYPIKKYTGKLPDLIEKGELCIRARERIPVVSVTKRGEKSIIDFGQNFAGIVEIDPTKMNGATLTLRHGEILKSDGELYTANLRKAKQQIIYYKGESTKKYRPEFTYMGFRYIELSGVEYAEGLIEAYAVYSDMRRTGSFRCDNTFVQKIYENQVWGQKSNYIEVPTDCPQRDERMGYTGDGQVFAETGAYNFDTADFWDKFLKDIRYSQADSKTGYVTPTVPATPGKNDAGFMSMLGWGNCVCIVPEILYRQYGDIGVIERNYESMKAFAECEIRKTGGLLGKKDLWIAPSLGDWLSLGKDVKYMALHNGPVSNAFLINDMRIMAWAAELLGKENDRARFEEQREMSKRAYIKAFIRRGGTMKDDYQGAYVMALRYVLDKGELWDAVFGKLIEKIKAEGMQTGFFATEHLLPLLCENGEKKLAFDILLNEKCPGWIYQIKRGATTNWERWDAIRDDGTVNEEKMSGDNMVSFNHYSFGSVGKFYYKYILGISPLSPGFSKVRIEPHTDERIGAFFGEYESRNGVIRVEFNAKENAFNIETPVDAVICINKNETEVNAGKYSFTV
ncbi:MAG: family 78 glycoside hydrolase catalytic domain [Clostridia bacterium]|nr:family 78 glycoside hydrolase catalytic domain [Clostridia bacterium]